MIEAALNVTLVTLHVCQGIIFPFGQCFFAVSHTMAFDVGFGYHINTVLVTKFVPEIVVRIVASAYGIQVELLHDLNVLNHAFFGNDISTIRVKLMTIGTLDKDRLAIHQ